LRLIHHHKLLSTFIEDFLLVLKLHSCRQSKSNDIVKSDPGVALMEQAAPPVKVPIPKAPKPGEGEPIVFFDIDLGGKSGLHPPLINTPCKAEWNTATRLSSSAKSLSLQRQDYPAAMHLSKTQAQDCLLA
jgi:hypothetical protein